MPIKNCETLREKTKYSVMTQIVGSCLQKTVMTQSLSQALWKELKLFFLSIVASSYETSCNNTDILK